MEVCGDVAVAEQKTTADEAKVHGAGDARCAIDNIKVDISKLTLETTKDEFVSEMITDVKKHMENDGNDVLVTAAAAEHTNTETKQTPMASDSDYCLRDEETAVQAQRSVSSCVSEYCLDAVRSCESFYLDDELQVAESASEHLLTASGIASQTHDRRVQYNRQMELRSAAAMVGCKQYVTADNTMHDVHRVPSEYFAREMKGIKIKPAKF